jgi:hypothetical protein
MTTIIPLILLKQGEGKRITPTVDTSAGAPDDIINFDFSWRMWHILTGTVLEKSVGDGITILDQTIYRGQLVVLIEPADTENLTPLTYKHQLIMSFGGAAQTVMEGLIQISTLHPGVTP